MTRAALVALLLLAAPVDRSDLGPWPSSSDHAIFRAVWAMNDRRKALGLPVFAIDARLNRVAADHAGRLGAGQEVPHARFLERLRGRGWTVRAAEGISFGCTSPEACVLLLDGSPDPAEGHRVDFEDPTLTHVGIAFARNTATGYAGNRGWLVVVDYGDKP